jgi:cytochrome c biogenesis protein CcdA/thiol-disulfide isomerase/thioredoxin
MFILTLFAFAAGIVTILSPCILPILPIVLSSSIGGKETGYARPVGIVFGFISSFTFFTLFLSTLVKIIGISPDILRMFSVVVIAGFGISQFIPQFQSFVEILFSKTTHFVPHRNVEPGFVNGFVIGLSLGLLWTPCVGPILASVIALAITGTVTFGAFIIILVYSAGSALSMFLVMIGGQKLMRKIPFLTLHTERIQKIFGVIMVFVAIGIFFNVDRSFQRLILTAFPQYGAGLTQLEDNLLVKNELDSVGQTKTNGPTAPEIIPGGEWFNSKPLTLAQLKGKVVMIDFWTYTCINCQRTLPYVREWWKKYKNDGLVVIGVHSPEFEFEKDKKNLAQAISDFGLTYPIVQDNEFATWKNYNNQYWPAKYLIDKDGVIRYSHFGEGEYDQTEMVIQNLLKETGIKNISSKLNNPITQTYAKTPETYVNSNRINNFSSPELLEINSYKLYSIPNPLPYNTFAFKGKWNITNEYAIPQKGSQLVFNFDAKEVYLVMKIIGKSSTIKVMVDEKIQYQGDDVKNGIVTMDSDRLYKLIFLPSPGNHILKLEFGDSEVELFAFTFG